MNNDLISRSELKKAIENYLEKRQDVIIWETDMLNMLDNAPSVDKGYDFGYADGHGEGYELGKNSRPQGEWKETGYETGALGITYRQTQCSNCGWEHALPMWLNFCPNCGAEMRRGDTE